MKKKGFTLVELLVVIAIIALLMGILMPALARVRMIAYRMVCGSNLSGIGKALLLYAGDNQEAYPMPGVGPLTPIYCCFKKYSQLLWLDFSRCDRSLLTCYRQSWRQGKHWFGVLHACKISGCLAKAV